MPRRALLWLGLVHCKVGQPLALTEHPHGLCIPWCGNLGHKEPPSLLFVGKLSAQFARHVSKLTLVSDKGEQWFPAASQQRVAIFVSSLIYISELCSLLLEPLFNGDSLR